MTELPSQLEQLKAALADRYHLERVLGEGGMATPYSILSARSRGSRR
jgi:hypothetical protein